MIPGLLLCGGIIAVCCASFAADPPVQANVEKLSVQGSLDDQQASLVIKADLKGTDAAKDQAIYATRIHHGIQATHDRLRHAVSVEAEALRGGLREVVLKLSGQGEVRQATGKGLESWSVQQDAQGGRSLVLRLQKSDKPVTKFAAQLTAETLFEDLPKGLASLSFTPEQAALGHGFVRVASLADLEVTLQNSSGLTPVDPDFLPEDLKIKRSETDPVPLAFRFYGAAYALTLDLASADPEARRVVLDQFNLTGQLSGQSAAFLLTARARVKNPKGGALDLLSGRYALTEIDPHPDWKLRFQEGRLRLVFERAGEYPIRLRFHAAIQRTNDWNELDFTVARAALQPLTLQGLPADTQFRFVGAARPERKDADFLSHLPSDGHVSLAWKEAKKEAEGRLFFSAEGLTQIAISPGVMRQTALFDFKVMQGELNQVVFLLEGEGEVTRVQGQPVLAWTIEPVSGGQNRQRLVVRLNQPQKDQFALQVYAQTALGAFPLAVETLRLRPEDATRLSGHFRIVNEGAVRLEVLQATGLSQISPEQFPASDAVKTVLGAPTGQVFAFRFSGGDYRLQIQADNILPELSVSQVLLYHLGETELAAEAEIELDVREAPVRELQLRVPHGYAIARLQASNLSDYFLTPGDEQQGAQLRLVYGGPVSGRQVIQLRLERNNPLGATTWALPLIEVAKAKSTRGHVAVSADAGFRLTSETTRGLTEIATAFFPRKVANLQAAFRLSDPAWQASLKVERLAQSIQADAFHLFSIGEGMAYGSSVLNYSVAGAPLAVFKVELSDEYFNVEFTGKDVRNWQRTGQSYEVYLHTPVAGEFTLLATYERPFKPQGDTLTFTGARPTDAQTEQGHTIVISAYQFQVQPANVSSGLLPLEPGEVPASYRLFFDAPVLAAYRYNSRPFNLQLQLQPYAMRETLGQVVDRAALTTRISEEGQVLTEAKYLVKNKGLPHLRLVVPNGAQLWSATVDGKTVVPVKDDRANLIPLPQTTDPNALHVLELKLAAKSANAKRLTVAAPSVLAPVLLTEWDLNADPGRQLIYRKGTLAPETLAGDRSGFAGFFRLMREEAGLFQFAAAWALLALAALVWARFTNGTTYRFSARHLTGLVLGLIASGLAIVIFATLIERATASSAPLQTSLRFVAPVQEAGSAISIDLKNLPAKLSLWSSLWALLPALLGVAAWFYSLSLEAGTTRVLLRLLGWVGICWGVLRWPNSTAAFLVVVLGFALLEVVIPSLRRALAAPPKPRGEAGPAAAAATAALILGCLASPERAFAQQAAVVSASEAKKIPPLADSVIQQIRVEEQFAFGVAKVRWQAEKGQALDLLYEPAVLTAIQYPTNALRLVQAVRDGKAVHQVLAQSSGAFDLEVRYSLGVTQAESQSGFRLPTHSGLINRVTVEVAGLDVELRSPQAVSVQPLESAPPKTSVATLTLMPADGAWVAWGPRARDTRREKPVFYVETAQLYVPTAGVIEGLHAVQVRPAQGELSELTFTAPEGLTISDVTATGLSFWRFDPDSRQLRASFSPPQARPFAVMIRSQIATSPLPYQQRAGLLTLEGAAGQVGLVGIATGAEVQLDQATPEQLTPINMEDFPASLVQTLAGQIPGLTVRRAFRYSEPSGTVTVAATAVEPDVRVVTRETLSLGEDRSVLAANLSVAVTRAGIFKLSFVLPEGLDVESISGTALSHWTELKQDTNRIITLHLRGRTEGQQQFDVTLGGTGVRAVKGWRVPRLVMREATKQSGDLVIAPEQGMRLQVATREGVTQLDPARSGIRQKGVLAFRLLHGQWQLALDIEQVASWIQVASLQRVAVFEGQAKVTANLDYQIENTGVKALQVRLPAQAESVRFQGEQVSDFLPAGDAAAGTDTRVWEIKLHRRMIGNYSLQVAYHLLVPEGATNVTIRGVQAEDVNLQRGFVAVQSAGRLQVRVAALPETLRVTDWAAIPRTLQRGMTDASANYVFRLVEPDFQLALQLDRHEAARLLPAKVQSLSLASVIADDAVMLTRARLDLQPGDKRLLQVTLPADAQFWFAFVNQGGAWTWRETNKVLIPLEPASATRRSTSVEFYYSARAGKARSASLDLALLGPQFDLPLENVTWQVYLNDKWELKDWDGTLQFQTTAPQTRVTPVDLTTYLNNEAVVRQEQRQEAEQLLSLGNTLLEKGDPQQARRAFQKAYGLSQHDAAFNEDARVQLQNLKMQQALVGLNVNRGRIAAEPEGVPAQVRALREAQVPAYTQQAAKQLIEQAPQEENAALVRLAERLIQQQDAAVANPTALRATLPEQGRVLTFTRSLQIDTWSDLRLELEAAAARPSARGLKLLTLVGLFAALAGLMWVGRPTKSAAA
jgi:hypothetical protein